MWAVSRDQAGQDYGSRSASRLAQTEAGTGIAYLIMIEPDQRLINRVGYYHGLSAEDYLHCTDAIRKSRS